MNSVPTVARQPGCAATAIPRFGAFGTDSKLRGHSAKRDNTLFQHFSRKPSAQFLSAFLN